MNSLRRRWQNFRLWWQSRYPLFRNYFIVVFLVGAFLIVYFWPYLNNRVFVSLHPGEAGVLWERFFGGTNLNYTYREGFHIVMPWNRMYVYNVRLQQTPHKIVALCKNGLPIELEVSIRHRPSDGKLPLLHTVVGPTYVETVIKPEIEAHVRAVVSQFEPTELYTSEGYILNLIVQGAMSELSERYVSLDDLLIKRISLPTKIGEAIESKLIEEQRMFEYEFRVKQAQKEADRKWYEAQGILNFQETVAAGGSFRDFLRYAGIQATVELSKSSNAKVVVIGNSESGGMPLILNLPNDNAERAAADGVLNKNPLTGKPPAATTLAGPPPLTPAPTFTVPPEQGTAPTATPSPSSTAVPQNTVPVSPPVPANLPETSAPPSVEKKPGTP